jgi:anti-sigma B factor antagonist
MPDLIVTVADRSPSGVVVRAEGELDLASAGRLRGAVEEARASGARVLLDLRALVFCDSSGLRLLLRLSAEAREHGWELAIRIGRGGVRRVVDMTHTAGLLNLVDEDAGPPGDGRGEG